MLAFASFFQKKKGDQYLFAGKDSKVHDQIFQNNSERPVDALAENGKLLTHNLKSRDASASKKEEYSHDAQQSFGKLSNEICRKIIWTSQWDSKK